METREMESTRCRIMAERSSTASERPSKQHSLGKRSAKRARWVVKVGIGESQDFPSSQGHRVVSIDVAFPCLPSGMELEAFCFDDHLCLWPGEIDRSEEHTSELQSHV